MKNPETLGEAFDLTKTHWRQIIEFLRKWYEENDRHPDMENEDDVPLEIAWGVHNCSFCSFFMESPCISCPLKSCGFGSLFYKFDVQPTIANAELMLAEIERKDNEKDNDN